MTSFGLKVPRDVIYSKLIFMKNFSVHQTTVKNGAPITTGFLGVRFRKAVLSSILNALDSSSYETVINFRNNPLNRLCYK